MKKILSLLLLCALLLPLASCASDPATADDAFFSAGGMSITLTKAFRETTDPKGKDGYCARFEADGITVRALHTGFFLAEAFADCTLEEYAETVISSNRIMQRQPIVYDGKETSDPADTSEKPEYRRIEPFTEGGLTCLEHVEHDSSSGVDRTVLSVLYKTGTAFWIVQFLCPSDRYEANRPFFMRWASAATFSAIFAPPETAQTAAPVTGA